MKDHRVLGIVLLLLGALLVGNPLYMFQNSGEINQVVVGNYYDREPIANYTYEELSPRGQEVVRDAIESTDNRTEFRGDHRRPSEFQFTRENSDSNQTLNAVYRIVYNDTNYTTTYRYRTGSETGEFGISDGEETPDRTYRYEDLSPDAQELFRTALEAPNNTTSFTGADRRPSSLELGASTDFSGAIVGGVYRVEYNGSLYTVETFSPPSVFQSETQRSHGLIALGVALCLVGGLYVWRKQPFSLGLTLVGFGSVLLVLNLGYRYAGDLLGPLTLFGSGPFIGIGLLVTIISIGYLLYKSTRERRTVVQ
jgi:hypothetical protein